MGLSGLTGLSGESGLITAAAVVPSGTNPGKTNLIAWWALDEESGNRADSHTNALTLTDNNTVLYTAGVVSNAALFAVANSEYLSHADDLLLRTGNIDFTLGCWVKLTTKPTQRFISKYQPTLNKREYTVAYYSVLDKFFFQTARDGGVSVDTVWADTLGSPSTGTFYFVIAEHDSVNDLLTIQVNNGTIDSAAGYVAGVWTGGDGLFTLSGNSNGIETMDGALDEAFFYKRLLTAEEKTWFYNGGAGRTYADLL